LVATGWWIISEDRENMVGKSDYNYWCKLEVRLTAFSVTDWEVRLDEDSRASKGDRIGRVCALKPPIGDPQHAGLPLGVLLPKQDTPPKSEIAIYKSPKSDLPKY
jgi:hypothetical protein